jgi:predicted DNA-binding transcriptional regulator AlpA
MSRRTDKAIDDEGFVDVHTIMNGSTKSRASIYRDIKIGLLARPVKISRGRVAWPKAAYREYLRKLASGEWREAEDQAEADAA